MPGYRVWLLGLVGVLTVEFVAVVLIASTDSAARGIIVSLVSVCAAAVAAGAGVLHYRRRSQFRGWKARRADPDLLRQDLARQPMRRLCAQWRASAQELAATGRIARLARVVRLRAELLDELERRDPEGFARWLHTDPLGGDPAAFLREDDSPTRSSDGKDLP